ncbi:LuxR C-terminal-related transcriptional regulator [Nocardiopsis sediminis]|uniref:LuxR C-terminal-related transcriptional regulator n=1 Tax=Nocardiopsis sediminis TaxID=1778267 RepID=A0ABV8FQI9_9ACTN
MQGRVLGFLKRGLTHEQIAVELMDGQPDSGDVDHARLKKGRKKASDNFYVVSKKAGVRDREGLGAIARVADGSTDRDDQFRALEAMAEALKTPSVAGRVYAAARKVDASREPGWAEEFVAGIRRDLDAADAEGVEPADPLDLPVPAPDPARGEGGRRAGRGEPGPGGPGSSSAGAVIVDARVDELARLLLPTFEGVQGSVLRSLKKGLTNEQIAVEFMGGRPDGDDIDNARLKKEKRRVENNLGDIYRNVGVRDREGVSAIARVADGTAGPGDRRRALEAMAEALKTPRVARRVDATAHKVDARRKSGWAKEFVAGIRRDLDAADAEGAEPTDLARRRLGELARKFLPRFGDEESGVLDLMKKGLTNKGIVDQRMVGVPRDGNFSALYKKEVKSVGETVSDRIYRKMGVSGRDDARGIVVALARVADGSTDPEEQVRALGLIKEVLGDRKSRGRLDYGRPVGWAEGRVEEIGDLLGGVGGAPGSRAASDAPREDDPSSPPAGAESVDERVGELARVFLSTFKGLRGRVLGSLKKGLTNEQIAVELMDGRPDIGDVDNARLNQEKVRVADSLGDIYRNMGVHDREGVGAIARVADGTARTGDQFRALEDMAEALKTLDVARRVDAAARKVDARRKPGWAKGFVAGIRRDLDAADAEGVEPADRARGLIGELARKFLPRFGDVESGVLDLMKKGLTNKGIVDQRMAGVPRDGHFDVQLTREKSNVNFNVHDIYGKVGVDGRDDARDIVVALARAADGIAGPGDQLRALGLIKEGLRDEDPEISGRLDYGRPVGWAKDRVEEIGRLVEEAGGPKAGAGAVAPVGEEAARPPRVRGKARVRVAPAVELTAGDLDRMWDAIGKLDPPLRWEVFVQLGATRNIGTIAERIMMVDGRNPSPRTVDDHVRAVVSALGVNGREQAGAVSRAYSSGLLARLRGDAGRRVAGSGGESAVSAGDAVAVVTDEGVHAVSGRGNDAEAGPEAMAIDDSGSGFGSAGAHLAGGPGDPLTVPGISSEWDGDFSDSDDEGDGDLPDADDEDDGGDPPGPGGGQGPAGSGPGAGGAGASGGSTGRGGGAGGGGTGGWSGGSDGGGTRGAGGGPAGRGGQVRSAGVGGNDGARESDSDSGVGSFYDPAPPVSERDRSVGSGDPWGGGGPDTPFGDVDGSGWGKDVKRSGTFEGVAHRWEHQLDGVWNGSAADGPTWAFTAGTGSGALPGASDRHDGTPTTRIGHDTIEPTAERSRAMGEMDRSTPPAAVDGSGPALIPALRAEADMARAKAARLRDDAAGAREEADRLRAEYEQLAADAGTASAQMREAADRADSEAVQREAQAAAHAADVAADDAWHFAETAERNALTIEQRADLAERNAQAAERLVDGLARDAIPATHVTETATEALAREAEAEQAARPTDPTGDPAGQARQHAEAAERAAYGDPDRLAGSPTARNTEPPGEADGNPRPEPPAAAESAEPVPDTVRPDTQPNAPRVQEAPRAAETAPPAQGDGGGVRGDVTNTAAVEARHPGGTESPADPPAPAASTERVTGTGNRSAAQQTGGARPEPAADSPRTPAGGRRLNYLLTSGAVDAPSIGPAVDRFIARIRADLDGRLTPDEINAIERQVRTDTAGADARRTAPPYFAPGGHTFAILGRGGRRQVTLALSPEGDSWHPAPRNDPAPAKTGPDSAPAVRAKTMVQKAAKSTLKGAATSTAAVKGSFSVNALGLIPDDVPMLGPVFTFSFSGTRNQRSTTYSVGDSVAGRSEVTLKGDPEAFVSALVAELTVDAPPTPRRGARGQGDGPAGRSESDGRTANIELAESAVVSRVVEPNGLSVIVPGGLKDRGAAADPATDAPAHIVLPDPFSTDPRHRGDLNAQGNRVGSGHPLDVEPIDGLKRQIRQNLGIDTDHATSAVLDAATTPEKLKELLAQLDRGPVNVAVLTDGNGVERVLTMWSVPRELTRVEDAPDKASFGRSGKTDKQAGLTAKRSTHLKLGGGAGVIITLVKGLLRLNLPHFEASFKAEAVSGRALSTGGVRTGRSHSDKVETYDVDRVFYATLSGDGTLMSSPGRSIEQITVGDARRMAGLDEPTPEAAARRVPLFEHLTTDRPAHWGGTTLREVTHPDGSRYRMDPPAGTPEAGPDEAPARPRTFHDDYARAVLTGIAERHPGLVVPDLATASKKTYARRPGTGPGDHRTPRERRGLRRDYDQALANTLLVLHAIADLDKHWAEWTTSGFDVHLIETARIDPSLANKGGVFRPPFVTVRLGADATGRTFGGTSTVGTESRVAGSAGVTDSRERAKTWTEQVKVGLHGRGSEVDAAGVRKNMGGLDATAEASQPRGRTQEHGVKGTTETTVKTTGDTDVWRWNLDPWFEIGKFRKASDLAGRDAEGNITLGRGENGTAYDGHTVRIQGPRARMEVESAPGRDVDPAQAPTAPATAGTRPTGRPETATPPAEPEATTPQASDQAATPAGPRRLTPDEARAIVLGTGPRPAPHPLDSVPTAPETVTAPDLYRLGNRLLTDTTPGFQDFLRRSRGAHDYLRRLLLSPMLTGNLSQLLSRYGLRSGRMQVDTSWRWRGLPTLVTRAARGDFRLFDLMPDTTTEVSSSGEVPVGSTRTYAGHTRSLAISGGVRPNPNDEVPPGTDPAPGAGSERRPGVAPGASWTPYSRATTKSTAGSVTASRETSVTPQGGSFPYTADLSFDQAAEAKKDWKLIATVPGRSAGASHHGVHTDVPGAEFGFISEAEAYAGGLVKDAITRDGDGTPAPAALEGHTAPRPDWSPRPGFAGLGHRRQGPDAGPAVDILMQRLADEGLELTGTSREILLQRVGEHLTRGLDDATARAVPIDVRVRSTSRAHLSKSAKITVDIIRQNTEVDRVGAKADFKDVRTRSVETVGSEGTKEDSTLGSDFAMLYSPFGNSNNNEAAAKGPDNRWTTGGGASHKTGTSATDKTTDTTAEPADTTIKGPYAVLGSDASLHLYLEIEGRDDTIVAQTPAGRTREVYPAPYLIDGGRTGAQAPRAGTPRALPSPNQRLEPAAEAWTADRRHAAAQDTGPQTAPPAPMPRLHALSVAGDGSAVTNAGYIAAATASGWQPPQNASPAATIRSARDYLVGKMGPRAEDIPAALTGLALTVNFAPAADGGTALPDLFRDRAFTFADLQWRLHAVPSAKGIRLIDVSVDSAHGGSRQHTHKTEASAEQSSTVSGGASAGNLGRPLDQAWPRGAAEAGMSADKYSTAAASNSTRTDRHRVPTSSKRAYLAAIPTTWLVAAESPVAQVKHLGFSRDQVGMAEVESEITTWLDHEQARELGLVDGVDANKALWDTLYESQEAFGEAEKTYFEARRKLPELVRGVEDAQRSGDATRLRDAQEAYDRQRTTVDDLHAEFWQGFGVWNAARNAARESLELPALERAVGEDRQSGDTGRLRDAQAAFDAQRATVDRLHAESRRAFEDWDAARTKSEPEGGLSTPAGQSGTPSPPPTHAHAAPPVPVPVAVEAPRPDAAPAPGSSTPSVLNGASPSENGDGAPPSARTQTPQSAPDVGPAAGSLTGAPPVAEAPTPTPTAASAPAEPATAADATPRTAPAPQRSVSLDDLFSSALNPVPATSRRPASEPGTPTEATGATAAAEESGNHAARPAHQNPLPANDPHDGHDSDDSQASGEEDGDSSDSDDDSGRDDDFSGGGPGGGGGPGPRPGPGPDGGASASAPGGGARGQSSAAGRPSGGAGGGGTGDSRGAGTGGSAASGGRGRSAGYRGNDARDVAGDLSDDDFSDGFYDSEPSAPTPGFVVDPKSDKSTGEEEPTIEGMVARLTGYGLIEPQSVEDGQTWAFMAGTDVPGQPPGGVLPLPHVLWKGGRQEQASGGGMGNNVRARTDNGATDQWARNSLPTVATPDGATGPGQVADAVNATADQVRSLLEYTGHARDMVDNGLATGVVAPGDRDAFQRIVTGIDAVVWSAALPMSVTVHLGAGAALLRRLGIGPGGLSGTIPGIVDIPHFLAGTFGTRAAEDAPVYIMLRVPNGYPAVYMGGGADGGRRLVLARASRIVIHAVYRQPGERVAGAGVEDLWFVEAEVVPAGWVPPMGWQPNPSGDAHQGYQAGAAPSDLPGASGRYVAAPATSTTGHGTVEPTAEQYRAMGEIWRLGDGEFDFFVALGAGSIDVTTTSADHRSRARMAGVIKALNVGGEEAVAVARAAGLTDDRRPHELTRDARLERGRARVRFLGDYQLRLLSLVSKLPVDIRAELGTDRSSAAIDNNIHSLVHRLGVLNRAEASAVAAAIGLIPAREFTAEQMTQRIANIAELTALEFDFLVALGAGRSDLEIVPRINRGSEKQYDLVMGRVIRTLDVNDSAEAVAVARAAGLTDDTRPSDLTRDDRAKRAHIRIHTLGDDRRRLLSRLTSESGGTSKAVGKEVDELLHRLGVLDRAEAVAAAIAAGLVPAVTPAADGGRESTAVPAATPEAMAIDDGDDLYSASDNERDDADAGPGAMDIDDVSGSGSGSGGEGEADSGPAQGDPDAPHFDAFPGGGEDSGFDKRHPPADVRISWAEYPWLTPEEIAHHNAVYDALVLQGVIPGDRSDTPDPGPALYDDDSDDGGPASDAGSEDTFGSLSPLSADSGEEGGDSGRRFEPLRFGSLGGPGRPAEDGGLSSAPAGTGKVMPGRGAEVSDDGAHADGRAPGAARGGGEGRDVPRVGRKDIPVGLLRLPAPASGAEGGGPASGESGDGPAGRESGDRAVPPARENARPPGARRRGGPSAPAVALSREQRAAALEKAENLPDRYRRALILRNSGRSIPAIAKLTGFSKPSIDVFLQNAAKDLEVTRAQAVDLAGDPGFPLPSGPLVPPAPRGGELTPEQLAHAREQMASLPERQKYAFELLGTGLSNAAIATKLKWFYDVGRQTAENYISGALKHLGSLSPAQGAKLAAKEMPRYREPAPVGSPEEVARILVQRLEPRERRVLALLMRTDLSLSAIRAGVGARSGLFESEVEYVYTVLYLDSGDREGAVAIARAAGLTLVSASDLPPARAGELLAEADLSDDQHEILGLLVQEQTTSQIVDGHHRLSKSTISRLIGKIQERLGVFSVAEAVAIARAARDAGPEAPPGAPGTIFLDIPDSVPLPGGGPAPRGGAAAGGRAAATGARDVARELVRKLADRYLDGLQPPRRSVLNLLVQGLDAKAIADMLTPRRTPATIYNDVRAIRKHLRADSRGDMFAIARAARGDDDPEVQSSALALIKKGLGDPVILRRLDDGRDGRTEGWAAGLVREIDGLLEAAERAEAGAPGGSGEDAVPAEDVDRYGDSGDRRNPAEGGAAHDAMVIDSESDSDSDDDDGDGDFDGDSGNGGGPGPGRGPGPGGGAAPPAPTPGPGGGASGSSLAPPPSRSEGTGRGGLNGAGRAGGGWVSGGLGARGRAVDGALDSDSDVDGFYDPAPARSQEAADAHDPMDRGHRPKPDFHARAKKNDEQPGSFEDYVDGLIRKYQLDVEPLAAEHARPWVFFEGTDPNDSSSYYGEEFAHYVDPSLVDLSTPSPVDDFDFSRFGEVDPDPANDPDGSGDVELPDAPSPTSQGTFDGLDDLTDGEEYGGPDHLDPGNPGDFPNVPADPDENPVDLGAWGEPSAESGMDVVMGDDVVSGDPSRTPGPAQNDELDVLPDAPVPGPEQAAGRSPAEDDGRSHAPAAEPAPEPAGTERGGRAAYPARYKTIQPGFLHLPVPVPVSDPARSEGESGGRAVPPAPQDALPAGPQRSSRRSARAVELTRPQRAAALEKAKGLTPGQHRVLVLRHSGLSLSEIGDLPDFTRKSADLLLRRAADRMGVSRAQAIDLAGEPGFPPPPPPPPEPGGNLTEAQRDHALGQMDSLSHRQHTAVGLLGAGLRNPEIVTRIKAMFDLGDDKDQAIDSDIYRALGHLSLNRAQGVTFAREVLPEFRDADPAGSSEDVDARELVRRLESRPRRVLALLTRTELSVSQIAAGVGTQAGAGHFESEVVEHVYRRLGVADREGAVAIAREAGLTLVAEQDFPPARARELLAQATVSPTQRKIRRCLAQGKTVSQIVELTGVKERTVKNYLGRMCERSGVFSRAELLALVRVAERTDDPQVLPEAPGEVFLDILDDSFLFGGEPGPRVAAGDPGTAPTGRDRARELVGVLAGRLLGGRGRGLFEFAKHLKQGPGNQVILDEHAPSMKPGTFKTYIFRLRNHLQVESRDDVLAIARAAQGDDDPDVQSRALALIKKGLADSVILSRLDDRNPGSARGLVDDIDRLLEEAERAEAGAAGRAVDGEAAAPGDSVDRYGRSDHESSLADAEVGPEAIVFHSDSDSGSVGAHLAGGPADPLKVPETSTGENGGSSDPDGEDGGGLHDTIGEEDGDLPDASDLHDEDPAPGTGHDAVEPTAEQQAAIRKIGDLSDDDFDFLVALGAGRKDDAPGFAQRMKRVARILGVKGPVEAADVAVAARLTNDDDPAGMSPEDRMARARARAGVLNDHRRWFFARVDRSNESIREELGPDTSIREVEKAVSSLIRRLGVLDRAEVGAVAAGLVPAREFTAEQITQAIGNFGDLGDNDFDFLVALGAGRAGGEIIIRLNLSRKEFSVRMGSVTAALGVNSRVEAATVAKAAGLTNDEDSAGMSPEDRMARARGRISILDDSQRWFFGRLNRSNESIREELGPDRSIREVEKAVSSLARRLGVLNPGEARDLARAVGLIPTSTHPAGSGQEPTMVSAAAPEAMDIDDIYDVSDDEGNRAGTAPEAVVSGEDSDSDDEADLLVNLADRFDYGSHAGDHPEGAGDQHTQTQYTPVQSSQYPAQTSGSGYYGAADQGHAFTPQEQRQDTAQSHTQAGRARWHASYDGIEDLVASERTGIAARRAFSEGGGAGELTELVQFRNGMLAVHKITENVEFTRDPEMGPGSVANELERARERADAEQLASLVGRAIGADVPGVYRVGPSELYMHYMNGRSGSTVPEFGPEFTETVSWRRLGLLDVLIGNFDRNPGNVLYTDQGTAVGIDHGAGWARDDDAPYDPADLGDVGFTDTMESYYDFDDNEWIDNPLTERDAHWLVHTIIALRPEFLRLGREDWYDEMVMRAYMLQTYASGHRRPAGR